MQFHVCLFLFLISIPHMMDSKYLQGFPSPQVEIREHVHIGGKDYYFGLRESLSWSSAVEFCNGLSMTLVSLEDQAKNDLIFNWILRNREYDWWYWTSGTRHSGRDWVWASSGNRFTYTNWAPREPDLEDGLTACLNFAASLRGWDDDSCWDMFLFPLCEQL